MPGMTWEILTRPAQPSPFRTLVPIPDKSRFPNILRKGEEMPKDHPHKFKPDDVFVADPHVVRDTITPDFTGIPLGTAAKPISYILRNFVRGHNQSPRWGNVSTKNDT